MLLLNYIAEKRVDTRHQFVGKLFLHSYIVGAKYRISGDLINMYIVNNGTFLTNIQPSLTKEMLEFSALKICTFLGVIGVK